MYLSKVEIEFLPISKHFMQEYDVKENVRHPVFLPYIKISFN